MATKYDGSFSLNSIFDGDTLTCSHINYDTKSEVIEGNNWILFRLKKQNTNVDAINLYFDAGQRTNSEIKPITKPKTDSVYEEEYDKEFVPVEVGARIENSSTNLGGYLQRMLSYPDCVSLHFDSQGESRGKLKLSFTVSTNGTVEKVFILKGVCKEVDGAVRSTLLRMSAVWKPAFQNREYVESEQEIQINVFIRQKFGSHGTDTCS
jgi:hypothetical protein